MEAKNLVLKFCGMKHPRAELAEAEMLKVSKVDCYVRLSMRMSMVNLGVIDLVINIF